MSDRYQIREVTHYEVIDTGQPEESATRVHFNGPKLALAEQVCGDMNENHQRALDAQARIHDEAHSQTIIETKDIGSASDVL